MNHWLHAWLHPVYVRRSDHDFLMRLLFSRHPVDCRAAMQNRRSAGTRDTYDSGDVTEAGEQMVYINIIQWVCDRAATPDLHCSVETRVRDRPQLLIHPFINSSISQKSIQFKPEMLCYISR